MALILDGGVRTAIARRRARGQDDRLFLRVEAVPMHGGYPHVLTVGWAPRRWPRHALVSRRVGDVEVILGPRIARYTQWRDLTISAWRLGPIEHLVVDEELLVLLDMETWERMHPGIALQQAG